MKNGIAQQEVLLVTGTGFAARQYCERGGVASPSNLSIYERLKDACWNGMLKEMLPEAFILNDPEAKLYLWQMREAMHFFALEMGEQPSQVDHYFSIDPYSFLEVERHN
ncbi:MAG TPA: hypothetical protein PKC39_14845 [Ferruginibacter sp.]|nr:hypothetical protein [Ferruginibacter sp.]HMP22235.1 hypothetical protein [Ferruginibacter sp.]